jgi:cyanophycin synthetase
VTGSHGTTRVARLTHHILHTHGLRTGLADTGGLFVGSRQLFKGNAANLAQARRLLMNREVEAAVIENDGMEILTSGLAYDICSIGIVTDIVYSDAFRQPEVAFHAFETAEDLVLIYRTQIDVVSSSGVGVLNADDANVAALAQYCDGSVTFYSVLPHSPVIAAHRAQGKRAVFIEQNVVVLADGASQQSFASLSDLNLSEKPQEASSTGEVLASIAAAWGLGVSQEVIKGAIRSFA